ncbi:MAG: Gfo/Idh/MocA family oxidoreductase [Phycisphaerales bacterium]|nr:MAG: Gfo/Idh/MocA family oxidoreductase [Phycisphaerales bacterium]
MSNEVKIGMVGVGRWGSNVLRAMSGVDRVDLRWICDVDQVALAKQSRPHPAAKTTTRMEEVLADPDVDAVAIATPAEAHCTCVRAALDAGKHVFVEKPLTLRSDDARDLVALAQQRGLKLMVGHVFVHHPVVEYLKSAIEGGELGDVYYAYSQRLNLGVIRRHENAWWSLAPHDVSIVCHLFDSVPHSVALNGRCFVQDGVEDVVFGTLYFGDGRMANVHASWLDPCKIRKVTVVGSRKMAVYDDMNAPERLRIYDKGADTQRSGLSYADYVQLRSGDILIPQIPQTEPLSQECRRFVEAVCDDAPIITDGRNGLAVVQILEAGMESLRRNGVPVRIGEIEPRSAIPQFAPGELVTV